jgi:thiamine pyrophosphokinase
MRPTVVISNGTYRLPTSLFVDDPLLVIADGGLGRILPLLDALPGGAVLVGDLDSAMPHDVDRWAAMGGLIERHPTDKDATDLELALRYVIDEPGPLTIVGGDILGRFDHLLGEVSLLAAVGRPLTAFYGPARVEVLTAGSHIALNGRPGEILSILPWSSSVTGITTSGLRWPLDRAVLAVGSTRGISNEFVGATATVSIVDGILIVIAPDAQAPAVGATQTSVDAL